MEWLKNWFHENVHNVVAGTSVISILQFLGQILITVQQSGINDNAFQQLLASSSGVIVFILLVLWNYLKARK